MDLIRIAKVVTLRSQRGKTGKYLVANDNKKSVSRAGNGSSGNERWSVELVPNSQSLIRVKSCYNNYLTASNKKRKLGGFKVRQTQPQRLDNSIEWEPIREGTHSNQIKLKTHDGTYLRACEKRWNTVTHENNANIQDGILWDVEILEITLEAASTCYDRATPAVQKLAHDYFESMDTDGDGKVSIDEFGNFFNQFDNSTMGPSLFAALDENGDGSLEFMEVFRLLYMINRPQAQPFMESLKAYVQQPGAKNERVKPQAQPFVEKLREHVQQPNAQNERVMRRAKTLLEFVEAGIEIGATIYGCTV